MKKWMALLTALLLCFGVAQAEYSWQQRLSDTGPSVKELVEPAQAAYPDWQVWETEEYWTGLYNGGPQHEHHCMVYMYRVEADRLLVMSLWTMANPLKAGDPVPWEESYYAPIPLTAEAAERIAAMAPEEVFEMYEGASLTEAALPGCAEFLVQEGEKLTKLLAYPDFLVGIVEDAQELESLRIGHWNGTAYDKVTATAMNEYIYINEIHSWNDELELYIPGAELWVYCGDDGVWRLGRVLGETEIDGELLDVSYIVGEDGLYTDDYITTDYRSNDWVRYGRPTFPTLLDGMDFAELPLSIEAVRDRTDASGYACVKQEGAGLYDAPEGNVLANCYKRLVGRVMTEQDGWVQLQIGSSEQGMTGWFRTEDMAFGAEVNEVRCSFPAYDDEPWWDLEDLSSILPEYGAELDPWSTTLWLIAQTPDGDWLVQVNDDLVCTATAEAIGEVGPTGWGREEDW